MPMAQAIELELLDFRTSKLDGGTMRLYEGALPATFTATPTGLLLAEVVLPTPSHNAATWNTGGFARATLSGVWQDAAANAGGTFGCFTVTDSLGTIVQRGPCGIATGAVPGQLIVSAATVAQGAPFNITGYTLEHDPLV